MAGTQFQSCETASGDFIDMDKQRHCYVNCLSKKIHLGFPVAGFITSIVVELLQLPISDKDIIDRLKDAALDLTADLHGLFFESWGVSCKDTCKCPMGASKSSCCCAEKGAR